jgi:hypothetical protein
VRLGGEDIRIPCRIYSSEPDGRSAGALSDAQRVILSCLYARHHDGFVREKYLGHLLHSAEAWVSPFVLQLLGEYVLEIILVIANEIAALRSDPYTAFVAGNPGFLELTRRRIISYWDCYYRRQFPTFRHYPGFQVFNAMAWWGKHDARRLLRR